MQVHEVTPCAAAPGASRLNFGYPRVQPAESKSPAGYAVAARRPAGLQTSQLEIARCAFANPCCQCRASRFRLMEPAPLRLRSYRRNAATGLASPSPWEGLVMRQRLSAETPKTRFDVAKAYFELQRIRRAVEREEATIHPTRVLYQKRKSKDVGSKSDR